jgi:hypothetical protein
VSILGEFERFFANVIFPNLVPVAIAVLLGGIALLVVAKQRRWDRTVRAHPRRAAAILIPILAVGLPVTWVLASPLFIRSELIEPTPTVVAGAPEPDQMVILSGTVMGADSFHTGSGEVSILETAAGVYTLRFESFSVLNGPDLHVYLSPDPAGYAAGAIDLGSLKATDGSFNYELPSGLDPTAFRSVVIWCQPFEVQFAHATLATG